MKQPPIILTLDAGGTNFSFSAIQQEQQLGDTLALPAQAEDLDQCIAYLKQGFLELIKELDQKPSAISFAFPGPADYRHGVIGELPNLPAFRGGGVPLGPILEEEFQLPVFINNDGCLFAYGESKAGFLPWVNKRLEEAGNPKRYKNLVGITLGTGFGVGVSINGMMLEGDNSAAAEAWKFRNKRHPYSFAEDTISIRALKRMYAEQIAMDPAKAPEPYEIYKISKGEAEGVQPAAREAFLRYGEVLGDAVATLVSIFDGLIVIGGGIAGAYPLFAGAMMDQLNSSFELLNGKKSSRIIQKMYNIEQDWALKEFLKNEVKEVELPSTSRKVPYFEKKKSGVGLSRLGTSQAITLGAYHYAVSQL
ncbi:ROK family protein [Gracilimonas mengyeensis]|uniref:Glucokinase n=1 Tax=Gracilimonas mengyeensis TaxID=1302730 RepID=A0A521EY62_9BACT|nr:ROK family protein [Gracilimonas mengyeensis]SMO88962.1 glucokinase [Gracilimonas mengyeensis]